jgi:hypothetical protein
VVIYGCKVADLVKQVLGSKLVGNLDVFLKILTERAELFLKFLAKLKIV